MAGAAEFVFQEAMVEARIMCNEYPTGQPGMDVLGQFGESWCTGHHVIGDAGERLDERWNRHFRVDQTAPLAHAVFIDLDDADFGNAIGGGGAACGFEVDESQARKRGLGQDEQGNALPV